MAVATSTAILLAAGAGLAGSAASARANKKAAEKANQPQQSTQTRVPYAEDLIRAHIPTILAEQEALYNERKARTTATRQQPQRKPRGSGGGQNTTRQFLNEVGKRALDAGNSPLIDAGSEFIRSRLESPGFAGNDLYSGLQDRLGNVSLNPSMDRLQTFLAVSPRTPSPSPTTRSVVGVTRGPAPTSPGLTPRSAPTPYPQTPTPASTGLRGTAAVTRGPAPTVSPGLGAPRRPTPGPGSPIPRVVPSPSPPSPSPGLGAPVRPDPTPTPVPRPGPAPTPRTGPAPTPRTTIPAPRPAPRTPQNPVPDATGTGLFGEEIRKLLEAAHANPADDPNVQALIDSLRSEALEGHQASLRDLDARIEGAGRFGSGTAQAARALAGEEFDEGLQQAIAGLLVGERQNALNRAVQGLGLVNTRDLGALDDATRREIARLQDSTARASIGAQVNTARSQAELEAQLQREAMEQERFLTMRNQELTAIGQMQQAEQFGLSTLLGLGDRLSNEQFNALGAIPGLEGIGLTGLNTALGVGNAMAGLDQIRATEGIADRELGFRREVYDEAIIQQQLRDYLGTILAIGNMGGDVTSVTPGANIPVPSVAQAALAGGLSGASTGAGMSLMYGG